MKLKMHAFDSNHPESVFKNPVYWHRDDVTGEKVKGKNPNIWSKIRGGTYSRTLFTDLNDPPQVIEWNLLQNVELKLVPLIHWEKIYVGAKPSLQVYMASGVVTKIVPAGTETRQVSTVSRLKEKYGNNLADQVGAQLADLRMARQDALTASSSTDFSSDNGRMHTIPPSDNTTTPSEETSVNDFLGNPPTMNSTPEVPTPVRLNVQQPTLKIN